MSDNRSEDHRLDDQLAEFTDQIFQREGSEPLPLLAEDEELRRLQQIVVRLKQARLADRMEGKSATRVRAALLEEWLRFGLHPGGQKNRPGPESSGLLPRVRNSLGRVFNASGWRIALASAVMTMLIILIMLPGNSALTASAGTQASLRPVGLGAGVFCLGILIWLLVKNRD